MNSTEKIIFSDKIIESQNTLDFNGKVLVIWSGGREHAFAWKLANSEMTKNVYVAPGNPWTANEKKVENINMWVGDIDKLLEFARNNEIWLTLVGPEVPLVAWIVDRFEKEWLRIFWPSKEASQLEWSKTFAKKLCSKNDIPTAPYFATNSKSEAINYLNQTYKTSNDYPVVIKADWLAAGKWVIIAKNQQEAEDTIKDILNWNKFWEAWNKLVIEKFLEWEEMSMIVMVDKNGNILPMGRISRSQAS